ncbi:MAG: hypothetical protein J5929_04725 [Eubacterium sp.]|nr:hypothetical protein [Eubacterium sp.]
MSCKAPYFIRKNEPNLNILVVLIGLVVIFKSQAIALVTKIWNAITDNAGSITG